MGKLIKPEDVLGRRISEIYCHYWEEGNWEEGGLGFSDYLFKLDNGMVFRLPNHSEFPWTAEDSIPPEMKLIEKRIEHVHGAGIACVLRPADDEDGWSGSAVLGLSSGRWIDGFTCAPLGVSQGFSIFGPAKMDDYVDFWSKTPA